MSLEQTKAEISARKTMIESKYSGGQPKRFWVFCFNLIMTIGAILAFGLAFSIVFNSPLYLLAAFVLIVVLMFFVEPDKIWRAITEWRKRK